MLQTPGADEFLVRVRFCPSELKVAVRCSYFAPGEKLSGACKHIHGVYAAAHGQEYPAHFLFEKVQVKLKVMNSLNCMRWVVRLSFLLKIRTSGS